MQREVSNFSLLSCFVVSFAKTAAMSMCYNGDKLSKGFYYTKSSRSIKNAPHREIIKIFDDISDKICFINDPKCKELGFFIFGDKNENPN